jgi:hypothetical protein
MDPFGLGPKTTFWQTGVGSVLEGAGNAFTNGLRQGVGAAAAALTYPVIGVRNATFLGQWTSGDLPPQINYAPNSPETQDMRQSPAAAVMRKQFTAAGEQNVRVDYATGRAFVDTIANPNTANWSSTAMQVGGFAGATVRNNGDGTASFSIINVAGANSFFYHVAPNNTNSSGPMHNVTQTFTWTESINK